MVMINDNDEIMIILMKLMIQMLIRNMAVAVKKQKILK